MYKLPKNRLLRVYIAGKISDDPDYKAKFNDTYFMFRKHNPKLRVFNPATLEMLDTVNFSWIAYIQLCLTILAKCDFVYFHKDYITSPGSQIEYIAAKKLRKIIFIQDEFEPENFTSQALNAWLIEHYSVSLNKYYIDVNNSNNSNVLHNLK